MDVYNPCCSQCLSMNDQIIGENFLYASTREINNIGARIIDGLASARSKTPWIVSNMDVGFMSCSHPPFSNLGVLEHTTVSTKANLSHSFAHMYNLNSISSSLNKGEKHALTVLIVYLIQSQTQTQRIHKRHCSCYIMFHINLKPCYYPYLQFPHWPRIILFSLGVWQTTF